MAGNKNNSKRILKNTIALYVRSFAMMLIALYTSRVVLKALGIDDYGLFNVIGGIITLLSFLRISLTKSTQRFLNTAMVTSEGELKNIFKTGVTIHLGVVVIAVFIAETIGLWFLNTHINIPQGREFAANLIYQATIISMSETLLVVPYTASIVAHEEMHFFAFVGILNSLLKLAIAIIISYSTFDRLILYGYLLMGIHIVDFLIYYVYCRRKYAEARWGLLFNKEYIRQMLGYTSWSIAGYSARVSVDQGNNILLNMFFSVVANASMGVANQVNHAFTTFTTSFQTAFNPQITKSYAQKDFAYLKKLLFATSKISFFLLTILSLPILFNINIILDLWLDKVPTYAALFCNFLITNAIINVLVTPLTFVVMSSRNIKWFQISMSVAYLTDLIILYPLFLLGMPPATACIAKITSTILTLFVSLRFACRLIPDLNFKSYFKFIILPLISSIGITLLCAFTLFHFADSTLLCIVSTLILCVISCLSAYFVGLNTNERNMFMGLIKKRINKK